MEGSKYPPKKINTNTYYPSKKLNSWSNICCTVINNMPITYKNLGAAVLENPFCQHSAEELKAITPEMQGRQYSALLQRLCWETQNTIGYRSPRGDFPLSSN